MKLYTKGGDKGTTSLIGGERVPKSDPRVEAYGSMDELMAFVGLLMTQGELAAQAQELMAVQRCLMCCSSVVALGDGASDQMRAKVPDVTDEDVATLERLVDSYAEQVPPLRYFVLPGGRSQAVALTHVARTVCRRCERRLAELGRPYPMVQRYVNRLSDYFFALGRALAHQQGEEQVSWVP